MLFTCIHFRNIRDHAHPYLKALRVSLESLDHPVIANKCLDSLLNIIRLLPYLGNGVYDGKLVKDACDTLFGIVKGPVQATDQGLCKAVKAYFSPVRTEQEQKDVVILVS